jgi:hypothetical protein
LSFERRTNPHRPGAAVVARAAFMERLTSDKNVLNLDVG